MRSHFNAPSTETKSKFKNGVSAPPPRYKKTPFGDFLVAGFWNCYVACYVTCYVASSVAYFKIIEVQAQWTSQRINNIFSFKNHFPPLPFGVFKKFFVGVKANRLRNHF